MNTDRVQCRFSEGVNEVQLAYSQYTDLICQSVSRVQCVECWRVKSATAAHNSVTCDTPSLSSDMQ